MAGDLRLDYLYASLADIQSTIRATDTKVSYLLVILLLPLTKLGAIYGKIHELLAHGILWLSIVAWALAFAFTAAWIIGSWTAMKTLLAIDNPEESVCGELPKSAFYPRMLFSYSFWDVLGVTTTSSTTKFRQHLASIPGCADEIARQLALEQMKGVYIASLKLRRSVIAYRAVAVWVCLGGALWFLHLVGI